MKQRIIGLTFVLKSREEKDRRIDSQFKNTLNELLGDASHYGSEIILRKIIMSQIALELAQNLGRDYHASTEELYYYMRKKDVETHLNLCIQLSQLLIKNKNSVRAIPKLLLFWQKMFQGSRQSLIKYVYNSAKYVIALTLFNPHTCSQTVKAHEAPL